MITSEASTTTADTQAPVLDWALYMSAYRRWIVAVPLLAGALGLAASFLMPPVYTAKVSMLPPQQQGPTVSALSALTGLSGLTGGSLGLKSASDQYIALMQSVRVADRIIDALDLLKVYDAENRTTARRLLESKTHIGTTRKDSLITVEVDDTDPARAAAIANLYVSELRALSGQLTLTEAQRRREFFERELLATKQRLATAQAALQGSGFDAGTLRAEPKSAAEGYARLKAELTQAEIQLQALRQSLTDGMPEVQRQITVVGGLRGQLGRLEETQPAGQGADYIGRYREYKYQEALFEIFSRQYETARLDESREGALIQVVDAATPPEMRSRPKRRVVALVSALSALALLLMGLSIRHAWNQAVRDPAIARRLRPSGPR